MCQSLMLYLLNNKYTVDKYGQNYKSIPVEHSTYLKKYSKQVFKRHLYALASNRHTQNIH